MATSERKAGKSSSDWALFSLGIIMVFGLMPRPNHLFFYKTFCLQPSRMLIAMQYSVFLELFTLQCEKIALQFGFSSHNQMNKVSHVVQMKTASPQGDTLSTSRSHRTRSCSVSLSCIEAFCISSIIR